MTPMPDFTPLPSRTKPDSGDERQPPQALIGEKTQGDNPGEPWVTFRATV